MKPPHSAILLFSRTPVDEAAAKTFDAGIGMRGNRAIARHLIRQSVAVSRRTRLPVFTSFSTEQNGASFGERLANAIEAVYARGFARVIVIGNDCPTLSTDALLAVNRRFTTEDLILGPAEDGGVYLIGMAQSAYDRDRFMDLPWEQPTLQRAWATYARAVSHRAFWLDVRHDMDDPAAFQRVLKALSPTSRLRRQLTQLLTARPAVRPCYRIPLPRAHPPSFFSLRAPPF